jgi:sugar phosphate isomerase/epimerase
VRHLEPIAHPHLGITLDLGHLHLTSAAYGWSALDEIAAVLPLLRHVHAHDNFAKMRRGPRYNSELPNGIGDLHLPMGWGSIPWAEVLPAMADYREIWMMEIEFRFFRHFPELVTAAQGMLATGTGPEVS